MSVDPRRTDNAIIEHADQDQDAPKGLLFDLGEIDLNGVVCDRKGLEAFNPHRGDMALLDSVIWRAPDGTMGLGVKKIRHDEFWVQGHFPGRPLFPGVLMIETGAQLACYMFNVRKNESTLAAFLRIENASFRSQVLPGDTLYILLREVKSQKRRFISQIQGVVPLADGTFRVAFDGLISGMSLGNRGY
jgi:3-hydroxyacyl-[acyl-carrier-protein] dehydratase